MDCVFIRGQELYCIIGLQDWEREVLQKVSIDIELETDCRQAGITDDVAHAADYKAVAKSVQELVETSRFRLVEALAENIAHMVLERFPVSAVTVQVAKPGAVRFTKTTGVRIRRERGQIPV